MLIRAFRRGRLEQSNLPDYDPFDALARFELQIMSELKVRGIARTLPDGTSRYLLPVLPEIHCYLHPVSAPTLSEPASVSPPRLRPLVIHAGPRGLLRRI